MNDKVEAAIAAHNAGMVDLSRDLYADLAAIKIALHHALAGAAIASGNMAAFIQGIPDIPVSNDETQELVREKVAEIKRRALIIAMSKQA